MDSAVRKQKQNLESWKLANPCRVRRHQLGLSIEDVATLIDKTSQSVGSYERGAFTPMPSVLSDLAKLFRVRPHTFRKEWDKWLTEKPTI